MARSHFEGNPATLAGVPTRQVGPAYLGSVPPAAVLPTLSVAQLQAALTELDKAIGSKMLKAIGAFRAAKFVASRAVVTRLSTLSAQRDALVRKGAAHMIGPLEQQIRETSAEVLGDDLVITAEQATVAERALRDRILAELGRRD